MTTNKYALSHVDNCVNKLVHPLVPHTRLSSDWLASSRLLSRKSNKGSHSHSGCSHHSHRMGSHSHIPDHIHRTHHMRRRIHHSMPIRMPIHMGSHSHTRRSWLEQ